MAASASSAKRAKPEDADEDFSDADDGSQHGGMSRTAIQGMFTDFASKIDESNSSLKQQLKESFVGMLTQYDAQQEARLAKLDSQCNELNQRQDNLEASNKDIWAAVATIQRNLDIVEHACPTKDPAVLDDENFYRPIDLTILRVNVKGSVTKLKIVEALTSWLDELQAPPGAWEINGPDMGKRFTIQF